MDSERISATEAATVAATEATSEPRIEIVIERRPAYSAAFRARVVAESSGPGVRAPDLARRYGIHVSLIYRWRRVAKAEMKVAATTRRRHQKLDVMDANAAGELPVSFIPLGIVGHPECTGRPPAEERGTLDLRSQVPTPSRAVSRRPRAAVPRRDRDERPSIIEIDMAGGTTLRVDATVDDGALRRVLAVLRSLS
jgi:transposase-like protein